MFSWLFIAALWLPAGKGLTSWLSLVMFYCVLVTFPWYPGSNVVLDCIDSGSLPPFLLFLTLRPKYEGKIGFLVILCFSLLQCRS